MRSIFFWCIMLLLWIVGGILFFQVIIGCCGFAGAPLLIEDGTTKVAHCSSNLLFGASTFVPVMGDEVKTEFQDVANYLNSHPDKTLTMTGLYSNTDESYDKAAGKLGDLGLARAEELKKHLVGLGVSSSQLLTTSNPVADLDFHENQLYGGMEYSFTGLDKGLTIKDGTNFSAEAGDNLLFLNSGFDHIKAFDANGEAIGANGQNISAGLKDALTKTAGYLKENPGRSIDLTGIYDKTEKYSGVLANLGLARANDVKNLLMSLGVPASQINTLSQEKSGIVFNNNIMTNGVSYSFTETANADDRLGEVESRLKAKPMILYFETNSDNITLNDGQRAYFSDLIYYLDNKKDAKVFTTGHTDDVGKDNYNIRLGKKRAQFVVNYLRKNGINVSKIETKSEGSNSPIAGNNTEAGKAKNRRVEITVN